MDAFNVLAGLIVTVAVLIVLAVAFSIHWILGIVAILIIFGS